METSAFPAGACTHPNRNPLQQREWKLDLGRPSSASVVNRNPLQQREWKLALSQRVLVLTRIEIPCSSGNGNQVQEALVGHTGAESKSPAAAGMETHITVAPDHSRRVNRNPLQQREWKQ